MIDTSGPSGQNFSAPEARSNPDLSEGQEAQDVSPHTAAFGEVALAKTEAEVQPGAKPESNTEVQEVEAPEKRSVAEIFSTPDSILEALANLSLLEVSDAVELEGVVHAWKQVEAARAAGESAKELRQKIDELVGSVEQEIPLNNDNAQNADRLAQSLAIMHDAPSRWNQGPQLQELIQEAFNMNGPEEFVPHPAEDFEGQKAAIRGAQEKGEVDIRRADDAEISLTQEQAQRLHAAVVDLVGSGDLNVIHSAVEQLNDQEAMTAWQVERGKAEAVLNIDLHPSEDSGSVAYVNELWGQINGILHGAGNPHALNDYVSEALQLAYYLKNNFEERTYRLNAVRAAGGR